MKLKEHLRTDDQTDAYGRSTSRDIHGDDELGEYHRHKKNYEKFFEGYTSETFVKPNGKVVTYRVYTGDIHRQGLDDAQRHRVKLYYGILLLSALILAIGALCLPTGSNYHAWFFIPGILPVFFSVRLLFAFSHYLTAGRDMKIHEFSSGSRVLMNAAKPSILIACAVIFSTIILFIVFPLPFRFLEFFRLLMLSFSCLIPVLISVKEQKIEYLYIPSKKKTS